MSESLLLLEGIYGLQGICRAADHGLTGICGATDYGFARINGSTNYGLACINARFSDRHGTIPDGFDAFANQFSGPGNGGGPWPQHLG